MRLHSTFGTPLNFSAITQNEVLLYLVLPSSTSVCVISDARPNTFFNLINLFLAALGVRCCARAFFGFGGQGLLSYEVYWLLTVVTSLVLEPGL